MLQHTRFNASNKISSSKYKRKQNERKGFFCLFYLSVCACMCPFVYVCVCVCGKLLWGLSSFLFLPFLSVFFFDVSYAQLLLVSQHWLRVLVDSQLKMKLLKLASKSLKVSVCWSVWECVCTGILVQSNVRTSMHNELKMELVIELLQKLCLHAGQELLPQKINTNRRIKVCNIKCLKLRAKILWHPVRIPFFYKNSPHSHELYIAAASCKGKTLPLLLLLLLIIDTFCCRIFI